MVCLAGYLLTTLWLDGHYGLWMRIGLSLVFLAVVYDTPWRMRSCIVSLRKG
jgi:hypothetical protein